MADDACRLRADHDTGAAGSAMSNLATVEQIDHGSGRGDVDFMIGRFRDDVVIEPWSTTAVTGGRVPYSRRREGEAGARKFYPSMSIEFTVKATGITVRDEEIQLWTFDGEGLVASLQHYGETAKHTAANGG